MTTPPRALDWTRLFQIACSVIRQVNAEDRVIDSWTLGGGTAMMIQIDHRESHDVDIFLSDPQLLAFLDPRIRDLDFEQPPAEIAGDGHSFLKFAFKDLGEIDFLVGRAMTASPVSQTTIQGEQVQLETIAEIITKKVYYRGSNIKPRDIFDIAAASDSHHTPIVTALRGYPDAVRSTLARLEKLNREFVTATIAQLAIRDRFRAIVPTALDRTTTLLRSI